MTAVRVNPTEWTETMRSSDGAKWNVTHLLDGRVLAWRDVDATLSSWGTWGVLYESKMADALPYPFTFSQRPTIRIEPYRVEQGAFAGFEILSGYSPHTHFPSFYALRPTAATIRLSVTIYATGYMS